MAQHCFHSSNLTLSIQTPNGPSRSSSDIETSGYEKEARIHFSKYLAVREQHSRAVTGQMCNNNSLAEYMGNE